MEIKTHLKINDTRFDAFKRMEIGQQVFLVSKQGVYQRKEVILHKTYEGAPMINGVAMNLDFRAFFVFKCKLLEVEAVSMICYGPLGDRLKLNVWYDGRQIGNWSALRSYMGGGTNGIWPVIQEEDGVLFFTFNRKDMIGVANELLIEFYRTVVSDPIDVQSKDPRKYIPSKDLPDDFLSQQFLLEELQSAKSIQWLIPVRDPSCNKKIGTLSCCAYPGYERYRKEYYGNLRNLPKNQKNNDFIAISLQGENLYTIVFEQNGFFQTKYPWNLTRISYEI